MTGSTRSMLTPTELDYFQRRSFTETLHDGRNITLISREAEIRQHLAVKSELEKRKLMTDLIIEPDVSLGHGELRKRLLQERCSMISNDKSRMAEVMENIDSALTASTNEYEAIKRLRLGADPLLSLRRRQVNGEARTLLNIDSKLKFDRRNLRGGSDFVSLTPHKAEIMNPLRLRESPSLLSIGSDIRKRIYLDELRKRLNIVQNQELLSRSLSRPIGIGNVYGEELLRQRVVRQQELLLNRLSESAPTFYYGGPSISDLLAHKLVEDKSKSLSNGKGV
eukprot:jgi/Psemu1/316912/fgenesh1_kg.4615_\